MTPQTIFAPATAAGRAGVAVLRVSGPRAHSLFDLFHVKQTDPRVATHVVYLHPETQDPLDDGLVLWFPGPRSFTGEDVLELHIHGGLAVQEAFLDVLSAQDGFRWAQPGEFSRRAFENGKLDLTQVEAIADLVDAETDSQRLQALYQLEGRLSSLYGGWRDRLLAALAHLEAVIDFPDEDLPSDVAARLWQDVGALRSEILAHMGEHRRGALVRDGLSVAIIGPPNAGKSSLLNALARRDAAIVSDMAGTTRDVVDVHLNIAGYAVIVSDTAGLREAADSLETEGIRRALQRAEQADIVVLVQDGALWPTEVPVPDGLEAEIIHLVNKADLLDQKPDGLLAVSATTGEGLDDLITKLKAHMDLILGQRSGPPPTRARHQAALKDCAIALERAPDAPEIALAGEDLRLALSALGRITGQVDVEDLLDVIFRDFCIGK